MKKDIHPTYYSVAKIFCSCGNVIEFGSTKQEMSTEICSACHPFYTGKKKIMDTAGKVERFKARADRTRSIQSKKISAITKKIQKKKKTSVSVSVKKKIKKSLKTA